MEWRGAFHGMLWVHALSGMVLGAGLVLTPTRMLLPGVKELNVADTIAVIVRDNPVR